MTKSIQIFTLMFLLVSSKAFSQSVIDLSAGASLQDRFFTNLAYRNQISEKFRLGLEVQFGVVDYRLIDAKPITKGYATIVGIPATLRLYKKEKIRLDLYTKVGFRTQGILDPDNNDKRDSILNSNSLTFDPGFLVTVQLSEKLNFQSGVTFPLVYQTTPSALFENIYPGIIHAGFNLQTSEKSTLFVKSLIGGGVGGNGDTQKLAWSIQGGIRFVFGKNLAESFVEPSF